MATTSLAFDDGDEKVRRVMDRPGTADEEAQPTSQEVLMTKGGFKLEPQPVVSDPLDPLNWTLVRKHAVLAIVMFFYFMFTYITTATVPSFPDLQTRYSLSAEQVNWTVAIPALGLAVGPLFWSSLADIVGRRIIMLCGTVIALASTIGCALAPNYGGYMAARFFQGFGVSPAATVGLATINDLFFEHERGQKVGLWVLSIDMGLLVGPLIGGFAVRAGQAWIQWHIAIAFGVLLLAELVFLPETLYPRNAMLNQARGSISTTTEKADGSSAATHPGCDVTTVARTKRLPFLNVTPVPAVVPSKPTDTIVRFIKMFKFGVVPLAVGAYCFTWYWWILSVITLVPIAYVDYSAESQGLFFIGLIIGTLTSEILCSGTMSDWLVLKLAKRAGGVKAPEMRLWLAYPGAVLTGLGMILWGFSVERHWHWITGQVAFVCIGAGIQMGNTAVCSYIVDAYPLQSMAVIVFYSVFLNLSAFVDPFFIIPWVDKAGFPWTMGGHAIITLCLGVPLLVIVHVFGDKLRFKAGSPDWTDPGSVIDGEAS